MTRKYVFVTVLILLGVSTTFFLFRRADFSNKNTDSSTEDIEQDRLPLENKAARLSLHPLASEEKIDAACETSVSTWEEWVERTVEIGLAMDVLYGWIDTSETLAVTRQKKMEAQKHQADLWEAKGIPVPKYPGKLPKKPESEISVGNSQHYQGPQTPKALFAEFDEGFLKTYPESVNWDEHYPREEFIQKLLDKGVEFKEAGDYYYYLTLRRDLITLKEQPNVWQSGSHGIPITNNFEEYKDGFIDRMIWEDSISKKVAAENPNARMISFLFPHNHPEKYLPVVGRMTYVRRKSNSGVMSTFGTPLTKEQKDNLLYKGLGPAGIEIVYIDEDYNILDEKPKPYNQVEWLKANTYDRIPQGLRAPDGTIVTPERYEEVSGKPMSDEIRQRYDEYVGTESPIDPNAVRREAAREAAAAAQEAAKVEFEKFQQGMRQLDEFATMSDAEIGKALEKQFRQQFLPKHPVEQLEQLMPERLEKALGTLFQHGFEEGFRRIRRDSPALAEQLEHFFGQGQKPPPDMQKKPERPAPPKPPEATPPETDSP